MTSTMPANISTTAGMIAGGGSCCSDTAAISVAPGISSRIASETIVAEVVASTLLISVCPSSCAPSGQREDQSPRLQREARQGLTPDQAQHQQQQGGRRVQPDVGRRRTCVGALSATVT